MDNYLDISSIRFDIQLLKDLYSYKNDANCLTKDMLDDTISDIKERIINNIDDKIKDLQDIKKSIEDIK
jgi:hypothetical protein